MHITQTTPTILPHESFPELFALGRIGGMNLKNRLCMAPMGTRYATDEGYVTGRQVDFYSERAKGGVGLVIVEATYIHPYLGRMLISDDKFIPGLAQLAKAIRDAGAKTSIEIQTRRGRSDLHNPTGPSATPHPITGVIPTAISKDDIKSIGVAFSEAALRAQQAGFDSIEIHGASGYLLNEFLSPLANKRTDEYGGSIENRARFSLETISRVRDKVGPDFPIIYRQCVDEHVEGGIPPQEAVQFARLLERAGVDAIEVVSGSTVYSEEWIIMPLGMPKGGNVALSNAIKKAVAIPVIVGGKLDDPFLAESVLKSGSADFISIGKALIADPQYPEKVKNGRLGDIRPCIHCLHCTDPRLRDNVGIRCTTNPTTGRENTFPIRPAIRRKRLTVIGGGPAGMQAALVLSGRGHTVTLLEKQPKLGGRLLLDTMSPFREESDALVAYFRTQLAGQGIAIKLDVEATPEQIDVIEADAIMVATGGHVARPPIPGANESQVLPFDRVLRGDATGNRVVILGSDLWASKTAQYIREQGRHVVMIESAAVFGYALEKTLRKVILQRLAGMGIQMRSDVSVTAIGRDGVTCRGGDVGFISADTVVLATGLQKNLELFDKLQARGLTVYATGECLRPGTLAQPIEMAFQEAFEIL